MIVQLFGAVVLVVCGTAFGLLVAAHREQHGPEPRRFYRVCNAAVVALWAAGLFGVLRVVFFGGACG